MSESDSEVEVWRDIPGYVGHYQVSSYGRVRTLKLIESRVRDPAGVLKPSESYAGRLGVNMCVGGKVTRRMVHILVLLAFKGPCPEGLEARHMDGNHLNNTPGNLEWGTHSENMKDKKRHGTQPRGSKSGNAKLTEQEVLDIRTSDLPQAVLGEIYGVSGVAIFNIRHRKTWRHI